MNSPDPRTAGAGLAATPEPPYAALPEAAAAALPGAEPPAAELAAATLPGSEPPDAQPTGAALSRAEPAGAELAGVNDVLTRRHRRAPTRPRIAPERRTRADVIVAAGLALAVVAAGVVYWRVSPEVATIDTVAAAPVAAPPAASGVPAAFTEVWRAASGATLAPVSSASAVVTGDGDTVVGHDPLTGAVDWSYRRDRPLCAVAAGFPNAGGGERLLALFRNGGGDWCSELTSLHPATGARAEASNPDIRPGTRLLANGPYVAATGERYLEVWRSDLVRTLQYGNLPTPVLVGKQPPPTCSFGSTALTGDHLGVIEHCSQSAAPAATERLTVVASDGSDGADSPQVRYSVGVPADSTLVALTSDHAAVATAGRLLVFDGTGRPTATLPLDGIDTVSAGAAGAPAVTSSDPGHVYWWTGSTVVALDAADLTPSWTAAGALGPPVAYGGSLLVPVAGGLATLDPANGKVGPTIAVARTDRTAPVRLATDGEILLEQRGTTVVALRP